MRFSVNFERSFEIELIDGLLDRQSDLLVASLSSQPTLMITTPTVDRYYGARVRRLLRHCDHEFSYQVCNLSEQTKTLESIQLICHAARKAGLGRHGVLAAFGGGVCLDVVGFSAAIIKRGISHLRIPTTLIGQVDAGIGIKTGVNFHCKNELGSFHPPMGVFVDHSFLRTLDTSSIRHGLAEIIKMALICDSSLFAEIDVYGNKLIDTRFQHPTDVARRIIQRSIVLMLNQLQENPYEDHSLKRLVDMGHTFSPRLEVASGFRMPHGVAVGIDMALTCLLSAELGVMRTDEALRVVKLISRLGLPVTSRLLTRELCDQAIREAVLHRGGHLNLVIPEAIGQASFLTSPSDLTAVILQRALDGLDSFAKTRLGVEDSQAILQV